MDPEVFEEVESILQTINEEHALLKERIKNMIKEYHFYHILEAKCEEIAEKQHHSQYFEKLHQFICEGAAGSHP
jgi:hypothetical protein